MTHICIIKRTIIGSDNGLSPGRCQVIIWTNAGKLWIWPFGTNISEILIKIHISSFKKIYICIHLKMSSVKCNPFFFIQETIYLHFSENGIYKMLSILSRPQCVNDADNNASTIIIYTVPFWINSIFLRRKETPRKVCPCRFNDSWHLHTWSATRTRDMSPFQKTQTYHPNSQSYIC